MAKSRKLALPDTVYVYEERDGNDFYLVAGRTRDELSDNERRIVGTYCLVGVGELQNAPTYTPNE